MDVLFCGVRGFRLAPIFFGFTTLDAFLVNVPRGALTKPQQLMAGPEEALRYGELLGARYVVPCADGGAPWYWREGMGPRYEGYPGEPVSGASLMDENPDADPYPERLVEVPTPVAEGGETREFRLSNREINGKKMDMSRIDFAALAGATEIWRVINLDGVPHNFHAHGVSFQVRSVDDAPPPAYLQGWKDTVYLRPHVTYELVVPLPNHRDPDTPFMYHCHLIAHEDQGMMGQFVVVGPGESPGVVGHRHHS